MKKITILFGFLYIGFFTGITNTTTITISQESYLDSAEKMYWEITNNTDATITAISDYSTVKIQPNSYVKLYRNASFIITIITAGKVQIYQTTNHVIQIKKNKKGKIKIRSFIE